MTTKDTINKAYSNVPKEVNISFDFNDCVPTWRGIKYYWYKLIRKIIR